jgi:hypothetical protein
MATLHSCVCLLRVLQQQDRLKVLLAADALAVPSESELFIEVRLGPFPACVLVCMMVCASAVRYPFARPSPSNPPRAGRHASRHARSVWLPNQAG